MFANFFKNTFKTRKSALPLFASATGLTLANYYQNVMKKDDTPQCCGIIGVVSKKSGQEQVIIEGIQVLQNRGYDSAGMSTISANSPQNFQVTKFATDVVNGEKLDCIDRIAKEGLQNHQQSLCGIGHTRWATCGGKTDANSHPHLDFDNHISLVHNGTLQNFEELKKELTEEHKIQLRSETDSELIAHIISLYMKQKNIDCKEAIRQVIEDGKIVGQWGLVVIEKGKPEQMIVARRGSPINIGIGDEAIYVASEKIGFQKYTNRYVSVKEGEIIELNINNIDNLFKEDNRIQTNLEKVQVQIKPMEPYKFFFEQEIHQQCETLMKTLGNGSRLAGEKDTCILGGLAQHEKEIKELDNIVIIACGSSLYASQYAATFLKKLQCMNSVQCIEGSEFNEYDLPLGKTGVVIVSQSGETADLRRALEIAQKKGIFSIGIINSVGSQIATHVDCGIYLNCGREVAVAATKSFTSQAVALIMMSIWISHKKDEEKKFSQTRQELVKALQLLPVNIGSTLADIGQISKDCAKYMSKEQTIICLGKGPCSAIAKEGALKLKELTYIHAEAFSAGELKHGPLALINPNTPKSTVIVMIILDDEYLHDMNLCLSEVHSRGALTVIITDCKQKVTLDKSDFIIEIQNAGRLTSLLCTLPFWKITSDICSELQLNPDKPRNLAKCVTTE